MVLDGNGVVELSNRQFNEKLRFSDDFDVLGRGVGTLSGQNMPAWYMSLIRHGRLDSEPVDFKTPDGDKVNLVVIRLNDQDPSRPFVSSGTSSEIA